MRLIDADVFISYLKEAVKGKDTLNVLIMEAVIGMVEIMAEKEPKNQWIPCSECEKRCRKWENSKTLQD